MGKKAGKVKGSASDRAEVSTAPPLPEESAMGGTQPKFGQALASNGAQHARHAVPIF